MTAGVNTPKWVIFAEFEQVKGDGRQVEDDFYIAKFRQIMDDGHFV